MPQAFLPNVDVLLHVTRRRTIVLGDVYTRDLPLGNANWDATKRSPNVAPPDTRIHALVLAWEK